MLVNAWLCGNLPQKHQDLTTAKAGLLPIYLGRLVKDRIIDFCQSLLNKEKNTVGTHNDRVLGVSPDPTASLLWRRRVGGASQNRRSYGVCHGDTSQQSMVMMMMMMTMMMMTDTYSTHMYPLVSGVWPKILMGSLGDIIIPYHSTTNQAWRDLGSLKEPWLVIHFPQSVWASWEPVPSKLCCCNAQVVVDIWFSVGQIGNAFDSLVQVGSWHFTLWLIKMMKTGSFKNLQISLTTNRATAVYPNVKNSEVWEDDKVPHISISITGGPNHDRARFWVMSYPENSRESPTPLLGYGELCENSVRTPDPLKRGGIAGCWFPQPVLLRLSPTFTAQEPEQRSDGSSIDGIINGGFLKWRWYPTINGL